MAWHISLSHRILRERWEDYWHPATEIRLDFLSNHWNMWLYKKGLHRLCLVLTQSLTTWKQHGASTKEWGLGHVRKPFLHTLSYWFLEGGDLHEDLQDGAGQGCCAGALWNWNCINILLLHGCNGPLQNPLPEAWPCLHMVPGAPIAVISYFASWFSHHWSSCF